MNRFQTSPFTLFAQLAREEDDTDIGQLAPPSLRGFQNLPLNRTLASTSHPILPFASRSSSQVGPLSPARSLSVSHPPPRNGHMHSAKSETSAGTSIHMIAASYPD